MSIDFFSNPSHKWTYKWTSYLSSIFRSAAGRYTVLSHTCQTEQLHAIIYKPKRQAAAGGVRSQWEGYGAAPEVVNSVLSSSRGLKTHVVLPATRSPQMGGNGMSNKETRWWTIHSGEPSVGASVAATSFGQGPAPLLQMLHRYFNSCAWELDHGNKRDVYKRSPLIWFHICKYSPHALRATRALATRYPAAELML